MTTQPQEPIRERRRRRFVIDAAFQWPASIAAGGIAAGNIALLMIARSMTGPDGRSVLSAEEASRAAILWNGVFLLLAVAVVVAFVLVLTHRVTGPERVLAHAVEGMIENDFSHRCRLRRRDYLRTLSGKIERLSAKLRDDRVAMEALLDNLEHHVESGNVDAALAAVQEMRGEWLVGRGPHDMPAFATGVASRER